MTHHEVDTGVANQLRDKQYVQKWAESHGEFLNVADLGYGPVSLGHEAAKELYLLKMAKNFEDEKPVQDL